MSQRVEYFHTFDAKHATNLGEESVSNPIQAVKELVKNAYDADAENVWITLVGNDTADVNVKAITEIIVRDDGYAMTDEDLRNKFFRIGTDSKVRESTSPINGRRVVGEKGMGHYAAKRLCNVINITSNPFDYPGREPSQSMNKTINVTLDWREFKHGLDFSMIKSEGEITERKMDQDLGLTLVLSELRDADWTVDDNKHGSPSIERLKKELGMLLIPRELKTGKDTFTIWLEAPGLAADEQGRPKRQKLDEDTSGLNMALFRLSATATYSKAKDKTEVKYHIDKKVKATGSEKGYIWDRQQHNGGYDNGYSIPGKGFGDAEFKVYWFPQGGKFYDEQKNIIGRKQIQDFLVKHSGIKLFQDNVGISGFGERGHPRYDWAGLDEDLLRKQMGGLVRLDTVAGFVTLTRDGNAGIREVANREAVMESPEFVTLKDDFVQKTFKELAVFRKDRSKVAPKIQHQAKAKLGIEQTKQQVRKFVKDPEVRSRIINHLETAEKEMKEAEKANKLEQDELIGSLDMYRPLSTLGLSILAFDHEMGPKFARINTYINVLKEEENLSDYALAAIKDAKAEMQDILAWREFLDLFATTLGSMGSSRKAREEINLREMVNSLAYALKPMLIVTDRAGNEVKIDVTPVVIGSGYKIKANRASLISVFSNMFINSIKSLRFAERAKPEINIKIWTEAHHLLIEFNDNGNGVPAENLEKIWQAFESFYPKYGPKSELRGHGLGLTLTREIIEEQYLGNIILDKTQHEDKENPGKGFATFLISIPLKELEEAK